MKNKHINKMTDKDLQELKDGLWAKLIFGKEIKENQAEKDKEYAKLSQEERGKITDKYYLAYRAPSPLDGIKKWWYGENKFNKLLLEQRDTNA